MLPTVVDVVAAAKRIRGMASRTSVRAFPALAGAGREVFVKMEIEQPTGSFKLRGAANAILSLVADGCVGGVVTASTGNHGRSVAYVAQRVGLRCIVCVSSLVPENKVAAIRRLGAEVVIVGDSQDDAMKHALELSATKSLAMIDPFDDPLVVAGQGTVGLEIAQDLASFETVFVPLSGGGLIAGVALAVKSLCPSARVVGVSSDRCPAMKASVIAGAPVSVPELPSLADSLGGGIGADNQVTLAMVRELVDEIILVSDDEIAQAMRLAYSEERWVLEGAGAAGIAGLQKVQPSRGRSVVVLSGNTIDPSEFEKVVGQPAVWNKAGARYAIHG